MVAALAVGCGPRIKVPTAPVTGTITVNGKPVEGMEIFFVPHAKIRPGVGTTDKMGRYEAKFLQHQWGAPLGPCTVRISLFKGASLDNLIPAQFNEKAADNPGLQLTVPKEGTTFNFDVKMEGSLPP